jgi:hypothetical protein
MVLNIHKILTGSCRKILILSRAEIPFLGLMRRYTFVTPLQDCSSFSRKTLPTDPVAPVRKIVLPSKYSGIDIIQQEPTT